MKYKDVLLALALPAIMITGCKPVFTQTDINPTNTAVLPSPTPAGVVIEIPSGKEAVIDGTLEDGEWEDALVTEMSDGSLLYLKYSGDSLYLAIDAQVEGIVNVGIIRGDELHILHSSAALGSAVYQTGPEGWTMTKNFDWCCRVSAPAFQLEDLLAEEGWLSHNQYYGDTTQTEYRIVATEGQIRLAITFLFMDQSGSAWWPVGLGETDLLQFSAPPSVGDLAIFSDQDWVTLIGPD